MSIEEYQPGTPFPGVIGRTVEESEPAWPAPTRARDGAPNVLFFVLDDVGYGQLSSFGGLVETPNIDRVAAQGLRYANMHTTALCSPTRSCILTGRNHHSNGVACIMELATGYPGYDGRMPFENGMLPEMLLEHGYNTFCLGKWHLSPSEDNTPAGPVPPLAARPRLRALLRLPRRRDQPVVSRPDPGQRADRAAARRPRRATTSARTSPTTRSSWSSTRTSTRPRSRSSCTTRPARRTLRTTCRRSGPTATRASSTTGWDAYRETVFARQQELGLLPADAELSPRDPDVPEWGALSADERRLYARMMEVFAGFVSHADHHFGRILDTLEQIGELDNTIIMVISDNGASAEGGVSGSFNEMLFFNKVPGELRGEPREDRRARRPEVLQPLPVGLDVGREHAVPALEARDLPRRGDRPVHRLLAGRDGGARRGPHAVRARDRHGPDRARRARASSRPEAIRGVEQSPLEGVSFAHTFDAPGRARRRHTTQYFEMFGHRSIYHDGWRAVCPWPAANFTEAAQLGRTLGDPITPEVLDTLDREGWELYDIAARPDRVAQRRRGAPRPAARADRAVVERGGAVQGAAARRLDAGTARGGAARRPPSRASGSSTTRAASSVPAFAAPPVFNRPYSIEADVEIAERGRRRGPGGPGRRRGRLHVLSSTAGACATSTTTSGATGSSWRSPEPLAAGPARAALRVRADRRAGLHERQGGPRARPALRRRRAGRQRGVPAHDAAPLRARGPELRLRLRRARRRRGTSRRSRSTARSTASRSTCPAS